MTDNMSDKFLNVTEQRLAKRLSHVVGDTSMPLSTMTIPELLSDTVSRFGACDALICPEQEVRLTYKELAQTVDDLAVGFLKLGLEKGDRVGIWSPNCLEWVITQFATARIGLILVNINPSYRVAELEYTLNKVECRALVMARSFKSSNYLGMIRELAPELASSQPGDLRASQLPHLRSVIVIGEPTDPGTIAFDATLVAGRTGDKEKLDSISRTLDPDDAINIQFTSGTTGLPKGATLSHTNIVNNARFVTDRIYLTNEDRLCIPVPLYHCFGMVMGVLGAVSKGAAIILPSQAFDPVKTLQALEADSCTALYGVPTMFVAMLQELEKEPRSLTHLRTGIMAGAPCPIEVMRRVHSQMNMSEVTICYGMTETAPVSFQSFVDDQIDKRCETVGRIHPHVEVKIIDSEGNTVEIGEQGEICTRGYSVMKGYWNDPEQTAASIENGWMHTGDLAVLDEEGFCTIVGRLKDMIIRGGENIYPREIEEFLMRYSGVAEVQVFGVPDTHYGEEVCAWIISAPGVSVKPEEVRDFCRMQIAHYKVPKHIRIVDSLPMTVTGKPQKFIMRDKMIQYLEESTKV